MDWSIGNLLWIVIGGAIIGLDVPERLFQRPTRRSLAGFMGISTFLSGRREADWLETSHGRLNLGPDLPAGHGLFAIRPEHVRVQAEPGPNTWVGTVVECSHWRKKSVRSRPAAAEAAASKSSVVTERPVWSATHERRRPKKAVSPMPLALR